MQLPKNFQNFMEREDLLPCSKEPSADPCPEPDESIPYHPILSKANFNVIDPPLWHYLEIPSLYKSLEVHVVCLSAASWHSHPKKEHHTNP